MKLLNLQYDISICLVTKLCIFRKKNNEEIYILYKCVLIYHIL